MKHLTGIGSSVKLAATWALTVAAGALAQGGTGTTRGVRLWNGDVLAPYQDFMKSNSSGPVAPIRIVGARNGSFSGKVVLGSDQPIRGLRAQMTDLVSPGGRIRASAVQVRYPIFLRRNGWNSVARAVAVFDTLSETPPEDVPLITQRMVPRYGPEKYVRPGQAYQPIWVTVHIPGGAKAGEYKGSLQIAIGGAKRFTVPVSLKVSDWSLPDGQDYATFVEFMQSPESVALQYDDPLWSDAHFKHLARSLQLLGRAGNRNVNIPLICETNLGNDESMVRWIEDGNGYKYDFTPMEKYLDAVEKHMGRPRNIAIYAWDVFLARDGAAFGEGKGKVNFGHATKEAREDRLAYRGKGPQVTLFDPATGKTERLMLPQFSDPRSRKLWQPLFKELRARIAKRKLTDSLVLGPAGDFVPSKETISFFTSIMPGVPWVEHTHGFYGSPKTLQANGARIKYVSIVFIFGRRNPRELFYQSKPGDMGILTYPRGRPHNCPIVSYRLDGELNASGKLRGFGRVGADFWPVMKDKRGRRTGRICQGRFPKSLWRNLDIRQTVLEPGPDGAISTVRFEMICEGVQESEARIFVEGAMLKRRISGALAARCKAALDKRDKAMSQYLSGSKRGKSADDKTYEAYLASGWQERSAELFELAGEVARKLGNK